LGLRERHGPSDDSFTSLLKAGRTFF
jgi:hypothetical protein